MKYRNDLNLNVILPYPLEHCVLEVQIHQFKSSIMSYLHTILRFILKRLILLQLKVFYNIIN